MTDLRVNAAPSGSRSRVSGGVVRRLGRAVLWVLVLVLLLRGIASVLEANLEPLHVANYGGALLDRYVERMEEIYAAVRAPAVG